MRLDLDPVRNLLPAPFAALQLTKEHSVAAALHARDAAASGQDLDARLVNAVRAATDLDHAVDNVSSLPVRWAFPSTGKYFAGYKAATLAVALLLNTDLVPAAREVVGKANLTEARETFRAGVQVARADASRFGGKLAAGWLDATIEDAQLGTKLLRSNGDLGRTLLGALRTVQTAADKRRGVDEALVTQVEGLFDDADRMLGESIAKAKADRSSSLGSGAAARTDAVLRQVDGLLGTARDAAEQLARDAAAAEQRAAASA